MPMFFVFSGISWLILSAYLFFDDQFIYCFVFDFKSLFSLYFQMRFYGFGDSTVSFQILSQYSYETVSFIEMRGQMYRLRKDVEGSHAPVCNVASHFGVVDRFQSVDEAILKSHILSWKCWMP